MNTNSIKALQELQDRVTVLRTRLEDESFLKNAGLGNEVGIYILCFDPTLQLEAQECASKLVRDSEQGRLPCSITECNLYDTMLQICEKKHILDRIPEQEAKRGTDALLKQLQKITSPEAFANEITSGLSGENDVLFITGVADVYPVIRVHVLLDNLQPLIGETPVVVWYPGEYSGNALSLFGTLEDGNYYRAFNLL
ncbi:DUF1788 domain-containing protein [Anaerotardibacter muris]|uniref:DUF1788 domain-containing protein n=1 Tax=Anaerotardibacter muris TaxID=2941505 RepID=UPI0020410CFF|nr:DUF1788 domain-containing protein [Anaerotardibacter muris]